MVNLHQYAVYIEQRVRGLLGNVERFGLGGIVNSDFIEYGGMVTCISAGLASKYSIENRESIDKFLSNIIEYNGVNFRNIGEEKLIEIYNNFIELSKTLK